MTTTVLRLNDHFTSVLAEVFAESEAHVLGFDNPLQAGPVANTAYVARKTAVAN